MEWGNYGVYNRPMSQSRTTTGILAIIVLAVIGYVLVTIPPRLFEGYHHAAEVSAWMGYAYLAVVGVGSLLLGGLLFAILLHVLEKYAAEGGRSRAAELEPEPDVGRGADAGD